MSGEIRVNITGNAQGLASAMQTVRNSTNTAMNGMTQSVNKGKSAMDGWAESIRGSRGLIYSFGAIVGTVTGVVFELETLNDAQSQVADSQKTLSDLEAQGKQGTEEYSRAQQSLTKDMRYLTLTTRNLALAFTNFIPEILSVVAQFANAKVRANEARIAFDEVRTTTKVMAAETVAAGGAVTGLGGFFSKSIKPTTDLRVAFDGVTTGVGNMGRGVAKTGGILAGFRSSIFNPWVAAIAAATTAFVAFIENWGGFRDMVNQAGVALGNFIPQLKFILDPIGKFGDLIAEKLGNKVPAATKAAGKGMQEMSKEAVKAAEDVQKAWESTLDSLVEMSKKERLKHLIDDLGFGKKGARKLEFGIEIVQDKKELFKQLEESLSIINEFHLPAKDVKQWANNMIEDIRDAMKDSKGKLDFMQGLIDVIKANRNKGGETLRIEVAKWFEGLSPALKAQLAKEGITVDEILKGMGINPETFGRDVNTALLDSLKGPQGLTMEQFESVFGLKDTKSGGGGGTGFIDQFIKNVTEGFKTGLTPDKLKDLGTSFGNAIVSSITWTANTLAPLFKGFVDTLKPLATPAGMAGLGQAIMAAVVDSVKWVANIVAPFVIGFGTEVGKLFTPQTMAAVGQAIQDAIVDSVKWTAAVVQNIVIGLGIEIGKLLTSKNLSAVGTALMNGIIGAAQLIGNLSIKFATWLAGKLGEIFTPTNLAAAGTALLNAIMGAAQFVGESAAKWVAQLGKDIQTAMKPSADIQNSGAVVVDQLGVGMNVAVTKMDVKQQDWWSTFVSKVTDAFTGEGGILSFFDLSHFIGASPGKKDEKPVDTKPLQQMTGNVTLSNTDAIVAIDTLVKYWDSKSKTIAAIVPEITANIKGAITQFDNVVRRMQDIGKMVTIPKVDVNIEKFIKGGDVVVKRLQSINKMKAVPKIDVNIEKFIKGADTVVRRLEDINKMTAHPKITVEKTEITHKKTVVDPYASRSNFAAGNAYANNGAMMNVIIVNTDDYDVQKKKKFRAELGRKTYRFG